MVYMQDIALNDCRGAPSWAMHHNPAVQFAGVQESRQLVIANDMAATHLHQRALGIPDVGLCWPTCPLDQEADQVQVLESSLCPSCIAKDI